MRAHRGRHAYTDGTDTRVEGSEPREASEPSELWATKFDARWRAK